MKLKLAVVADVGLAGFAVIVGAATAVAAETTAVPTYVLANRSCRDPSTVAGAACNTERAPVPPVVSNE